MFLQGLPISTLTSLKGVLSLVSSSAMKGNILMGELPAVLAGTEFETKVDLLCKHMFFLLFLVY